MAEVLGAASTVVALVEFSGKVLALGYGYIAKFSRAPSQLRATLSETSSLNTVLDSLQALAQDDPSRHEVVESLEKQGVFTECKQMLERVQDSIKTCEQRSDEKIKNFGKRMIWPLKDKDTKQILSQSSRIRSILSAALTVDNAVALKKIEDAAKNIHADLTDFRETFDQNKLREEHKQLLAWLCPVDTQPEQKYDSLVDARMESTGHWLLDSHSFVDWTQEPNSVFWLYGPPGVGKSTLSASALERLHGSKEVPALDQVVYFYCDSHNPSTQTCLYLLMNIAKQMLQVKPVGYKYLDLFLRSRGRKLSDRELSQKLRVDDYVPLILYLSANFRKVFIVIDALDESTEIDSIVKVMTELKETSASASFHFFITSRNNMEVEIPMTGIVTHSLHVQNHAKDDIDHYVRSQIQDRISKKKLKLRNSALAEQIQESIVGSAKGLFLQARLQLEYVTSLRTDKAIKDAISRLPNGLEATYSQILLRIQERYPGSQQDIKVMLYWITKCTAPVTLGMLAEAIALQPEETYLDVDAIATDPEDLVMMLSSLIYIDRRNDPATVHLAHSSLEEFLESESLQCSSLRFFHIEPVRAYRTLAETCIQYLSLSNFAPTKGEATRISNNLNSLKQLVVDMNEVLVDEYLSQYSLLGYAAVHWPDLLLRCNYTKSMFETDAKPLLSWFLDASVGGVTSGPSLSLYGPSSNYLFWLRVNRFLRGRTFVGSAMHSQLFYAIVFGLHQCLEYLLPYARNLDDAFPGRWTPLTAAVNNKRGKVIMQLLSQGVDLNAPAHEVHGSVTALHIAAENGNADVVTQLISLEDVELDKFDDLEMTPFHRAMVGGSLACLEILYKAGADINKRVGQSGHSPISFAATKLFNKAVVEKLLSWGADTTLENKRGHSFWTYATTRTPKQWSQCNWTFLAQWLEVQQSRQLGDKRSPNHMSAPQDGELTPSPLWETTFRGPRSTLPEFESSDALRKQLSGDGRSTLPDFLASGTSPVFQRCPAPVLPPITTGTERKETTGNQDSSYPRSGPPPAIKIQAVDASRKKGIRARESIFRRFSKDERRTSKILFN